MAVENRNPDRHAIVHRRQEVGSGNADTAEAGLLAALWMAIAHLFAVLLFCLTTVGRPLGSGNLKLAAVAVAPLGKR